MFADWRWQDGQIVLSNDRYGLYPLYYCDTGRTFRVSSSIPRLIEAGAPRDIDEEALAVLLRLGFCVGEDTPFRAIRALPPGARLIWRPGHLELTSALPRAPRRGLARSDAIDVYVDLFRRAMQRRAPRGGRVVVPLSGGQDSRHILLELLRGGHAPVCVTARYYPPRDTPDAEIASRLARALGLEHHILEQPASQLQTTRRHHLATNFCTLTPSSYALAVGEWLRQEADVVYDGLGGDVLSAGLFLDAERVRLFAEGRLAELADNLLAGFNGGSGFHERMLAQALPAENQRRLSHDLAARRLVRELERHAGAADPVGSFCFFNRTRRDIALVPFRAYAGVPTVHCPYVDRELFDFLFSLPAEMLLDHTFHKDTLARAFPEWAALPYAEWSVATGGRARRHYRRFTWEIARYCSAGAHARPLRRSYVVPRLARALVDPRYGRWAAWVGPLIVYLDQLQVLGALGG